MKLRSLQKITLFSCFMLSLSAHADWLKNLKDAVDVVKQTGVAVPYGEGKDANTKTTAGVVNKSNNVDLPMGLTTYPDSELKTRFDNPFARVDIPISVPNRAKDSMHPPVDYKVPVEGKLTMLQFKHIKGSSPLLIQKHYESWLAANGFERMLICETPCKKAEGIFWLPHVDTDGHLDASYLPVRPTYVAAYKENAMAIFAVGATPADGNVTYSSFVKVVEGRVIDNSDWKTLMTPRSDLPAVEPSQPAPSGTTSVVIPPAGSAPVGIKDIAPNSLLKELLASKGLVVVQLSSYDANCGFCVRGNPYFDTFAKKYASKLTFWRATAQPWLSVVDNDFARTYRIGGVPATFLFKDGQLVRQLNGIATESQLDAKLLN